MPVPRCRHPCQNAPITALTLQQREIAGLVAKGLTNGEIAERLDLTRPAVATQIREILTVLGLPTRIRLALWFLRQPHRPA